MIDCSRTYDIELDAFEVICLERILVKTVDFLRDNGKPYITTLGLLDKVKAATEGEVSDD